jgi:hypothetical protein
MTVATGYNLGALLIALFPCSWVLLVASFPLVAFLVAKIPCLSSATKNCCIWLQLRRSLSSKNSPCCLRGHWWTTSHPHQIALLVANFPCCQEEATTVTTGYDLGALLVANFPHILDKDVRQSNEYG